jgi:hypothetical protein
VRDGELFKTGLLVRDLPRALADLGAWLELRWTPIQETKLSLWTRHGREEVPLRFVYSLGGPPFLELLEARPSGYYAASQGEQLHHVGRWVGDLKAASAALAQQGFALEACGIDAAGDTPSVFAFHRGAHGLRVELVDAAQRPGFEAWLAGGELVLP